MSEYRPNHWLRKSPDEKRQDMWRAAEKRTGKAVGGKGTPGSGARWHSKGDVKTKKILFEVKSTDKSSMSVKRHWLDKIEQEAFASRRMPVLVLVFGDKRYYVLREAEFQSKVQEEG